MEPTKEFIFFLQSCIAPVTLISGVGLMLLTITNRLGRTVDRSRHLVTDLDNPNSPRKEEKINEIKILYKRSKLLQTSIASIIVSIFTSSSIIANLVIMSLLGYDLKYIGYFLFLLSIVSIMVAAIYFFLDILLSLKAIYLEATHYLKQ